MVCITKYLDSIEVDHFMRRMSDKDVIDTLEAIRPFAKTLKIELQDCCPSFMLELILSIKLIDNYSWY